MPLDAAPSGIFVTWDTVFAFFVLWGVAWLFIGIGLSGPGVRHKELDERLLRARLRTCRRRLWRATRPVARTLVSNRCEQDEGFQ